ncbi:Dynein light chain, cytoplasmic [Friedmanniomyces endolithicus]|uniref:Dynein light chain n=1 Tax=Friedmanniomyces endolithicus TaxID=329885 RepID=A0A4U0TZK0_9PEZI|nr:Dynein light chain [Friedmanniomyces endolithicus]TKA27476.1 Dynein light chain, cytoplasmic [Friedmanniomyces endolithicus]
MAATEKDATDNMMKPEKLEAEIKSVDMSEDMQQEAIEVAQEAMDKFNIEKVRFMAFDREFESLRFLLEIAHHIKRTFDERKGATWHCIVGRNFGSFVTHETKHFIYFYLGHCAILLFKTQ